MSTPLPAPQRAETFTLLGGKLALHAATPHPPEDALWLAASLPTLPHGAQVLDAACGPGTAALALLTRQPHLHITALDSDPTLTQLAAHNATLNNHTLTTITADLLTAPALPRYHAILCNPPFYTAEHHHPARTATRNTCKHLPCGAMPLWLSTLTNLLTPCGTLHMVLHAACAPQLTAFAANNHALTITPLQTSLTRAPKRILAQLRPHPSPSFTQHPNLPTAPHRHRILHHGEALYPHLI